MSKIIPEALKNGWPIVRKRIPVQLELVLICKQYFMGLFSFLSGNNNNNVQLEQAIKDGALLVDVRSPAEFRSGSVPGAINIPLDTITQQLSRFKGAKNIVVFCRSGNRSRMAEQILKQNGYTMVVNGGTWQQVRQAQSN